MPSVLAPYSSSHGNSPYTSHQLRELWKSVEPSARSPGRYSLEERVILQREFLKYIANGFTATRAVDRLQELSRQDPSKWPFADYGTFMAWKRFDEQFSEAYEVAYAMGTDRLEDKGVEMAYGGNASMLQFMLKARNPTRYSPKEASMAAPLAQVTEVRTIQLVAASNVLEIEDQGGARAEGVEPADGVEDAEYYEVPREERQR